MKTLNHPVALRMESGGLNPRDTKDEADLRPNRETQVEIKARGQGSAVVENSGTASGHLEVLSIIVNR